MDERSLSYKDLADKMGLSKQRVSSLFNVDNGITLNTVEKIAEALGIEETDLFQPHIKLKLKTKSK